jgi:hypothetical protein
MRGGGYMLKKMLHGLDLAADQAMSEGGSW